MVAVPAVVAFDMGDMGESPEWHLMGDGISEHFLLLPSGPQMPQLLSVPQATTSLAGGDGGVREARTASGFMG